MKSHIALLLSSAFVVSACGSSSSGGGGGGGTTPATPAGFRVARGANGIVQALAPAGGGAVYAGGTFTHFDDRESPRLARVRADGAADPTFVVGAGFDGDAKAIALAENGDVYVGGAFFTYNGTTSRKLIRLNPDGSVDAAFNVGAGFLPFPVYAVAPAGDGSGDVYVGGDVTSYDGTPIGYAVRLNADGTIDTSFAMGTGFDGGVAAIVPAADGSGDVYFAGGFLTYDGTAVNGIARLNPDGSLETAFSSGAGFAGGVWTMAPADDGSGDVYVGGEFTTYDGAPVNRLVRLNPTGSRDAAFSIGTGFDLGVFALTADGAGGVYAGGTFTSYDGTPRGGLVRLDENGTPVESFALGAGFNIGVVAVLAMDGDVVAGGYFDSYAGMGANRLARLNADGSPDAGFALGSGFGANGFTADVRSIASAGGGKVYVGGNFTRYDGFACGRVARLNADGSFDTSFAVGAGFNVQVDAVAPAVDGSGDVYVGGAFTMYGAADRMRIARLNSDGSLDAAFAVGTGFNDQVLSIVPAADGSSDVFVAGQFTSYDGTPSSGVIRLNADGSVDSAAPGAGCTGGVAIAMAAAPDGSGDLYVGGTFTGYAGTPSPMIVRLNGTLSIDTPNPGGWSVGFVTAIAAGADSTGDLFVGGTTAPRIARVNANLTLDTAVAGTGFDNFVLTLTAVGGDVYVGGWFVAYNGGTARRIIRLNGDLTEDGAFVSGAGFDSIVRAILLGSQGELTVGGDFLVYRSSVVDYIARVAADGSLD